MGEFCGSMECCPIRIGLPSDCFTDRLVLTGFGAIPFTHAIVGFQQGVRGGRFCLQYSTHSQKHLFKTKQGFGSVEY